MSIIEKSINEIINTSINLENFNIDSTASLESLGFDSIEVADILVKIQRKFTIKLDLNKFSQMPTLNAIYQYVEAELKTAKLPY